MCETTWTITNSALPELLFVVVNAKHALNTLLPMRKASVSYSTSFLLKTSNFFVTHQLVRPFRFPVSICRRHSSLLSSRSALRTTPPTQIGGTTKCTLLLAGPPMRWNVFLAMDDFHGVSSHASLTHWCYFAAEDVYSHQFSLQCFIRVRLRFIWTNFKVNQAQPRHVSGAQLRKIYSRSCCLNMLRSVSLFLN